MKTTPTMSLSQVLARLSQEPTGSTLPLTLVLDKRTATALAARGTGCRMLNNASGRPGPKPYYVWLPSTPVEARTVPQRLTSNMLNPEAGQFLTDDDTPSYCDPGCESYHSM